jgi:hypothetical protein
LVFAQGTDDTTDNVIGGPTPGDRNVVSGNTDAGVFLMARNTRVQGNFIGLNAAGTSSIPNDRGVWVGSNATPGTYGWGNNIIGGLEPGEGNTISGNTQEGVFIIDPVSSQTKVYGNVFSSNGGPGVNIPSYPPPVQFATGVTIRENTFAANGRRAIVLTDSWSQIADVIPGPGVPSNDAGDSDSGPNNLQNFPVTTGVTSSTGSTTIAGALNSTPDSNFTIEFFGSPACDPSGHGPGETLLGSTTVVTDSDGDATFSVTLDIGVAAGSVVASTATNNATGDTSEFSACWTVGSVALGSVDGTIVDSNNAALPGATVSLTNVATNATRVTTTNASGRFFFPYLAPGSYTVTYGVPPGMVRGPFSVAPGEAVHLGNLGLGGV